MRFLGKTLYNYLPDNSPFLSKVLKWGLDKIDVELISLGNLISSGEKGWKFLIDDQKAIEEIIKGAESIADSLKGCTTGIMISKETTLNNAPIFEAHQFHRYSAEDEMHLFLKEDWKQISDYESAITSKYKVRMRKIFDTNKHFERKSLSLADIIENRDRIDFLFNDLLSHVKFKLVEIDASYFIEMKRNQGVNFFVDAYYADGQMKGFISYFYQNRDIDVHYIGYEASTNQESKLYNKVLYDMLLKGIEGRAEMICYGRTAHEIKKVRLVRCRSRFIITFASINRFLIKYCHFF
ncbi:MAG: hypothetical protein IPK03_15530 [Bacteroidetes bacterium]|nr:hypothetical protein [Bacteroidota bacterium]